MSLRKNPPVPPACGKKETPGGQIDCAARDLVSLSI